METQTARHQEPHAPTGVEQPALGSLGARVSRPPDADWYAQLSPPARAALKACMTRRSYRKGQTVFLEGDRAVAMFCVVSGSVRLQSVPSSGKENLTMVYGPGRCFGMLALLNGDVRHHYALADHASVLEVVQAADFLRIADEYPEVYKATALSCAAFIRELERLFLSGYTLEERLARRLDFLLDLGATRDAGSQALRLDITLDMLAASVAVSRQAISKLLQDWHGDGIISHRYGSVAVLDRVRLRQIAGRQIN